MNQYKFTPVVILLTIILFFPVWVQADDDKKYGNPFKKLQRQINGLYHKVHHLKVKVARLEEENAAQNGLISTLQAQVANILLADPGALAAIFAGVSRTDNDIFFDGVNVHIRSGSGATDGNTGSGPTVNGLGNLIVGYDEERGGGDNKTGSHNLVVGKFHNYPSYGGLVAGEWNTVSGRNSSATGGVFNIASGFFSSISGGNQNTASGHGSSISGGLFNIASGGNSSVSGGDSNTASGIVSSVSGGTGNTASDIASSVSGGLGRAASGQNDWAAGSLFEDF